MHDCCVCVDLLRASVDCYVCVWIVMCVRGSVACICGLICVDLSRASVDCFVCVWISPVHLWIALRVCGSLPCICELVRANVDLSRAFVEGFETVFTP